MKIIVEVGHPAHVHFFKNVIWNLENMGHNIKIAAIDKDITLNLLNSYNFDYEIIGGYHSALLKKAYELIKEEYRLLKIVRIFKPDIFIGRGSPSQAHISTLTNKPFIAFCDTEHASLIAMLTYPFTEVICTPSCFKRKLNSTKHVTFNGYLQLAYLHPNYFTPDPSVMEDMGLSEVDKFIVIRLTSWKATHDTRSSGVSPDLLAQAIKSFEDYGFVFITSEQKLNKNLEKYKLNLAVEKMHSVLYYANLHFGEGGATAMESALLGTPTVHFEAFRARSGKLVDVTHVNGIFDELVNKYKALYTFADENKALDKSLEILQDKNAKKEAMKKRDQILAEKIDVTAFMTDFIENYPESFYAYQKNKTIGFQ